MCYIYIYIYILLLYIKIVIFRPKGMSEFTSKNIAERYLCLWSGKVYKSVALLKPHKYCYYIYVLLRRSIVKYYIFY